MTYSNTKDSAPVDVSIIVPLVDEQENVSSLCQELVGLMDGQTQRYEAIIVDDGSQDQTVAHVQQAIGSDDRFTIVVFTRNFGQSAALAAGFRLASGRVIVPIDGDGQNDPADIPLLVSRLDEPPGWDIVSGWRKNRQDKFFSRCLPSVVANRIIQKITWTTEIHDFGCSLKAYRRDVLDDVHLYGEMHRYLAAICKWRGARITEMVVNHRARRAGASKYGLNRTFKVLLDLLTVKFMGDYLTKPIYFFGKLSLIGVIVSFGSLPVAIIQKFGYFTEHGGPVMLNNNVLVLFAMMTFLMAVMFLMMGVISELLVRDYHESQDRTPYKIRRIMTASNESGSNEGDVGSMAIKQALPLGVPGEELI